MPRRKRYLNSSVGSDARVASVSEAAAMCYEQGIPCGDLCGRLPGNPAEWTATVAPARRYTPGRAERLLLELTEVGLLVAYEVGLRKVVSYPAKAWIRHQGAALKASGAIEQPEPPKNLIGLLLPNGFSYDEWGKSDLFSEDMRKSEKFSPPPSPPPPPSGGFLLPPVPPVPPVEESKQTLRARARKLNPEQDTAMQAAIDHYYQRLQQWTGAAKPRFTGGILAKIFTERLLLRDDDGKPEPDTPEDVIAYVDIFFDRRRPHSSANPSQFLREFNDLLSERLKQLEKADAQTVR